MPGQDVRQLLLQVDASVAVAQRNLSTLRNQVERDTQAMEGALQKPEEALGRYANAHGAVVHASGNARVAQMELMHVVRSSTDSFASGQHVMTIFAQEVGRVAEAVSFAGGGLGRFGAIMSGGWGIAIAGGISLLTLFISHLMQEGESLDSLVEKKKHDARQSDLNAQADAIWRTTLDGLTATINQQNDALQQRLRLQAQVRDADLAQARQNIATGEQRRGELLQQRSDAGQRERQLVAQLANPNNADPRMSGPMQGDLTATRQLIADLDRQINQLNGTLRTAGDQLSNAQIERDRALATQEGQINDRYDRLQAALEERYRNHLISEDALRAGETSLDVARQHALQGIRQAETAERQRNAAIHDGLINSLYRPVPGSVLSPFGVHRAASGTLPAHDHAGVDLNAPFGSDVHAPFAGTARRRDNPTGLGWYVELRGESGLMARLAHLSGFNIPAGEAVQVSQGQVVGYSGGGRPHPGAGNAAHTPSHLHYELWQNGHPINPVNGRGGQSVAEAQRAAEAAGLRQTREDDQFQVALSQASERLVQAKRELAGTTENQVAFAIEQARIDGQQRDEGYQRQVNEHQLTEAEAKRLRALNDAATEAQVAALRQREDRRLADEAARLQVELVGSERDILQTRMGLADTDRDRLAIGRRILANEKEAERLQLTNTLRFGSGASSDQIGSALIRYNRLDTTYAARGEALDRQYEGPRAQYLRQLRSGVADVNTQLQSLEVRSMQALDDATRNTIKSVLHLHGAFGDIIADLIMIYVRRAALNAIDGASNGGGGFLGTLLRGIGLASGAGGGSAAGVASAGSAVARAFGGAREGGGPVSAGMAYLVGEKRPEIFVPHASGTILPRVPQVRIPVAANLNTMHRVVVELPPEMDAYIASVAGPVSIEVHRRLTPGVAQQEIADAFRVLRRKPIA